MISVFTKSISPRLQYVLDFCFQDKNCPYTLITSSEEWEKVTETKFNYSNAEIDCDYAIDPSGLLKEDNIDPTLKLEKDGDKLLIRGSKDPLSIIFYLLSRYEEHQSYEADKHGRFTASQSQQKELGVLYEPIADQIVKKLWKKLGLDYSKVQSRFELVPSFDIDVAWAYKNRPFWRKIGAFSKGKIGERIGVLFGLRKDPYDTYSQIMQVSTQVDRIICFAPVGDYGPLDKNISWKNENYRSLLRGLNSDGGMGLHPGYQSHLNADKIEVEKIRLEEILGHSMQKSRFHFLKFQLPESYEQLISLGFTKDYSMGFSDDIGFRAGTSFPFNYFNLKANKKENFLIFPFMYMDSAFKDNLKLSAEDAAAQVEDLMLKVKNVGGLFMCIWHNHSINDKGEWKGWKDVLEKTVKWSKD